MDQFYSVEYHSPFGHGILPTTFPTLDEAIEDAKERHAREKEPQAFYVVSDRKQRILFSTRGIPKNSQPPS